MKEEENKEIGQKTKELEDVEVPTLGPEDRIKQMMEDLQEQIEDDPDIEEGQYFFKVIMMPKTEGQANMMVAKVLDDVIHEDSDEESQMSNSGAINVSKYNLSKVEEKSENSQQKREYDGPSKRQRDLKMNIDWKLPKQM